MARKKYNYNFVRKPSEGGKEALYMAGASVFLFLLASVVSFAFRGNGGIFLGAAGLFSFLLSGYGFYVGMKSFKEECRFSARLRAAACWSHGWHCF